MTTSRYLIYRANPDDWEVHELDDSSPKTDYCFVVANRTQSLMGRFPTYEKAFAFVRLQHERAREYVAKATKNATS